MKFKYLPVLFLASGISMVANRAQASTVYVESNQGDQNSLLAYDLSADGTLQAKATVATNGKGIVDPSLALGPFDSDQQIISNPEKTFVFAVNSGSNTIAVFKTDKTGALTQVPGSPFDSHGVNPVSVGLKGNQLIVVNKHGDPAQAMDATLPNYTTFQVAANGSLKWSGYTSEVANGTSPSQALVSPFGYAVFGADFLGGILRSYSLYGNGALAESSTLGIPALDFPNAQTPRLPLGLAANPKSPLIYVGLPTANKIAVYSYNQWGVLTHVGATQDSGAVVCWLRTNRAGTRLYASNTADPSITVYDISGANARSPKELQKVMVASAGGSYQITLSPTESQFLVLTQRFQASTPQGQGNEIHVFNVDKNGELAPVGTPTVLSLPADVRPQGLLAL